VAIEDIGKGYKEEDDTKGEHKGELGEGVGLQPSISVLDRLCSTIPRSKFRSLISLISSLALSLTTPLFQAESSSRALLINAVWLP